ncbi:hypothetical protein [Candidatus Manganitrophus noduliformans]|uniref:Uncharacterized protein n=1 Tax=Candidatus Manganitrophus noduliformans TaxID=2606439 RepID=A0A7X6I9Y2_9BACT|nr:hypothetical protein [Candidatus Manganitrophus noduliformans]NKE69789.1 hypothetical protein [Candidatus Manganitrophus noduliformans]
MLHNKERIMATLRSLSLRDKVLMINMFLYFAVGGAILYRAFFRHASWPAYLIGSLFLLIGSYRFYLIYKALSKGGGGGEVAER